MDARRAVPLLAVSLLVAFTTCDQAPTVAPDDVGIRAAPGGGGGKPDKAEPNPSGCAEGQVAEWDATAEEWVCADAILGATTLGVEQRAVNFIVPAGQTRDAIAFCQGGKVATGGGYAVPTQLKAVISRWTQNAAGESGWEVRMVNTLSVQAQLTVYVVCINPL